jgi:putative transposase
MEKFKGKYRVESTRLKGYDYSSEGHYFITICANEMQHFFGRIINGEMHLSEIGKLAEKFWLEIPNHFPNAILNEFIIMPNHIHGIITLKERVQTSHCDVSKDNTLTDKTAQSQWKISNNNNHTETAQSQWNISNNSNHTETARRDVSAGYGQNMAAIRPKPGSLPVIIRSYKSVVSKHARKINPDFKWLERYYDRIIRDNREFQNVQNYIRNNPKNWRKDQEFFL